VEASCEHSNKLWVPRNIGKFLSSCTTGGFSRRAQFSEVNKVYRFVMMVY
jgi:hypothetical protein